MADPVNVDIDPINTWQKVATAINTGGFINKESEGNVYYSYVETGNPKPATFSIGNELGIGERLDVVNSVAVDVYFYAKDHVAVIEVQV